MWGPALLLLLPLALPALAAPDFSPRRCSLERRLQGGGELCFLEPECGEVCSPGGQVRTPYPTRSAYSIQAVYKSLWLWFSAPKVQCTMVTGELHRSSL
jgi:hypothetical protein